MTDSKQDGPAGLSNGSQDQPGAGATDCWQPWPSDPVLSCFRSPKDYMHFSPRGCECMAWQADFGRLAW